MVDELRDELRKLDAEVAEKVMGWSIVPEGNRWRVSRTGEFVNSWCVDSPNLADLDDDVDDRLYGRYAMPRYSTDIAAAFSVEDRIAEMGHADDYTVRLHLLVANSIKDRAFRMFDVVHATPEQRCRAALATISKGDEASEVR